MVFVYGGAENDTVQTPTKDDILRWYAEQSKKELTPYKDVMAGLTLLPQEPVPGKIVNRTVDKATGMVTLTLSNGATVIIHKTDFEKDKVLLVTMLSNCIQRALVSSHTFIR